MCTSRRRSGRACAPIFSVERSTVTEFTGHTKTKNNKTVPCTGVEWSGGLPPFLTSVHGTWRRRRSRDAAWSLYWPHTTSSTSRSRNEIVKDFLCPACCCAVYNNNCTLHGQHNFINVDINLSHYSVATCFGHFMVIPRPTTSIPAH